MRQLIGSIRNKTQTAVLNMVVKRMLNNVHIYLTFRMLQHLRKFKSAGQTHQFDAFPIAIYIYIYFFFFLQSSLSSEVIYFLLCAAFSMLESISVTRTIIRNDLYLIYSNAK